MANGTAQVLNRVRTILRTKTDEYFDPEEAGTHFVTASDSLLALCVGLISQYQPGRPVPAIASQVTSDVRMLLQPFQKKIPFVIVSPGVYEPVISDLQSKNVEIIKWETWYRNDRFIRMPSDNQTDPYLDSSIDPPTEEYPYARTVGDDKIQVWPPANATVEAFIIHSDVPITVAYNPDKTIDEALTTKTLWGRRAYDALTYLILANMGISTQQPPLIQAAMAMQQRSL